MQGLGLPTSFGKASSAVASSSKASLPDRPTTQVQRGGIAGRGPRGIVGSGHKGKGRRQADNAPSVDGSEMNTGVKRPHPTSANRTPLQSQSASYGDVTGARGLSSGRGNGMRQGGHGAPRGSRLGGERGNEAHGYFKESFCEDPWRDLLDAEQKQAS